MKHWVTHPIMLQHPFTPELVTRDAFIRFAQTAEAAGFSGIAFTDHPAPSHKWLTSGGHDALDPFTAFGFVAGVTERIRLIPNILVLPYRNPFLVAKAVATLDLLSEGRFTLSVATGYLRSEYAALGVDFDERNDRFDEAIEVIRGVWAADDYRHEGAAFSAHGVSAYPRPQGKVPLWIGGNSRRTRQRVAAVGDGWNPFPAPAVVARTSKTPALETVDELAAMLDELWRFVDDAGRDPATIDVSFGARSGGSVGDAGFDAGAHCGEVEQLAKLGVTWHTVGVPGDSLAHALESLERYGAEVIAPMGG